MSIFSQSDRSTQNNVSVVTQLLSELSVKVTPASIRETLDNHPDFGSLLSISDSLQTWGIVSKTFKVKKDKLPDVPVPFITYSRKRNGVFVTVIGITNEYVTYLDPFGKRNTVKEKIESFHNDWDEVALVVESVTMQTEKDYELKRSEERRKALINPLIAGCFLLLVVLFIIGIIHSIETPWIYGGIILAKFIGSIITSLLLTYEIDKTNPFIQQVCSAAGKADCSAVLESKGSKLFSWLSWSEVGFFYFAGSFLFLLLGLPTYNAVPGILMLLNLCALPYTVFSIYYQWRVVKQWCPLCLGVQFLLIIEAFLFYLSNSGLRNELIFKTEPRLWLLMLFAFSLPILFWIFSKRYFIAAVSATKYKAELNKLKYNQEFFEALLKSQKFVGEVPEQMGLTIGNPSGTITIIKVCNPYCAPCARAHVIVEQILSANKSIRLQIIFNASPIEEDPKRPPVRHLLFLAHNEPQLLGEALDDWYLAEAKDYHAFSNKYPRDIPTGFGNQEILQMHEWCEKNRVGYTPTFFINGYQLPAIYQPFDLLYLLPNG